MHWWGHLCLVEQLQTDIVVPKNTVKFTVPSTQIEWKIGIWVDKQNMHIWTIDSIYHRFLQQQVGVSDEEAEA